MKRVFIIHGWGGFPEEGWFPWLKQELEKRGFEVMIPSMPHTEAPLIHAWMEHLTTTVGLLDQETFFIGHSIGCLAILRYLEKQTRVAGGAVFVAGWIALTGLESAEEKSIAEPWFEEPIDFLHARALLPRSVAILSDNDPFVPFEENEKIFAEKLGAEIVVEHQKGHLSQEHGIMELPSVCEAVLRVAHKA